MTNKLCWTYCCKFTHFKIEDPVSEKKIQTYYLLNYCIIALKDTGAIYKEKDDIWLSLMRKAPHANRNYKDI